MQLKWLPPNQSLDGPVIIPSGQLLPPTTPPNQAPPGSPGTDTIVYLHSDHLGSVGATTDANGALLSKQRFDPWGKVLSGGNVTQTKINYTGQKLDTTGLLNYNARLYDPVVGRFVSPDSIVPGVSPLAMYGSATGGGGPGHPQALNRYSYVLNNPVVNTDPSGHCRTADGDSRPYGNYPDCLPDNTSSNSPTNSPPSTSDESCGDDLTCIANRGLYGVESHMGGIPVGNSNVEDSAEASGGAESSKGRTSEEVGAARVSAARALFEQGGYTTEAEVSYKDLGMSSMQGAVDVLARGLDGKVEALAEVGGKAKGGKNLPGFTTQLGNLRTAAAKLGAQAYFYYALDTPQEVLNEAIRLLGADFVKPMDIP
jgi:RHS repeat-associated protein